jgi:hypothetical protein
MNRIEELDDTDRKILLYVAAHRDIHGEGPTWGEIREALQLPARVYLVPDPLISRIRRLKRRHHLWFAPNVPRSTDIRGKSRRALGMGL